MTIYRTQDNDTLDRIAWQHYGSMAGTVEAILNANHGLADYGAILPRGVLITLPDYPKPPTNTGVRLWD